ncbi:hypothetical protein GCM10011316_02340 [Roseibium aquae]|uniref:Photosynthetic complex assembly protein 2 n=1 Tax=Roseibium aquae TaxID=1323746 RepID=A0A916T926_9HYPH|nr:putative photosynthetic complex assembly protein PuhE [Roseibium aquae]GGB33774.1 hypothetical protein GCM10011316_02340 [Roseibium aquae]
MTALTAAAIAVFIWWTATGAVMLVARFGSARGGAAMAVMSLVALAGVVALGLTRNVTTEQSAYIAFMGALAIWAWHETAFLLGLVTGPRRVGLHQEPREKTRFRAAFKAVRDHEIGLALTALVLFAWLHDAGNTAGLWTYLLLWGMRLSTKMIIFLGAPHAFNELLPHRLSYLESYFRTDRLSPLFWVSLVACICILTGFSVGAGLANYPHDAVKWGLLAAFAALALIEHAFLVLPVRDSLLWTWALRVCPVKTQEDETQGLVSSLDENESPARPGVKSKGNVSWI